MMVFNLNVIYLKVELKKAAYNCVYGALGTDYIKDLAKYNVKVSYYLKECLE